MLERLVAALVVIGALLWGASLLATPDELAHEDARGDVPRTPARVLPDPVDAAPLPPREDNGDDDEDDEDDEDEKEESSGKGKKKRGRG